MSMTPFRWIDLDGPSFGEQDRVWSANLQLGAPLDLHPDEQPPNVCNHSIRLLMQAADPDYDTIKQLFGTSKVYFHAPLLLTAAATAVRFQETGNAPNVWVLGARFRPCLVLPADKHQWYADIRVAPRQWPPDHEFEKDSSGKFEIAAPRLRITRGRIPVAHGRFSGDYALSNCLAIRWGNASDARARIFGNLWISKVKAARPDGSHLNEAIAFDLVPDGVEFEVFVPNPFGTATTDELQLRLRLVAAENTDGTTGLRLDLVGGEAEHLKLLRKNLVAMTDDLARRRGVIALQIDDKEIPPLSWPLTRSSDGYNCGAPGQIPAVQFREDEIQVRILTAADFGGAEAGTAALTGPGGGLGLRGAAAPMVLTLSSAAAKAPLAIAAPNLHLAWNDTPAADRDPDSIELDAFPGLVKVEPVADRLTNVWGASGAVAPGTRPPCAFVAVDRGWLQLALPNAPKDDAPEAVPVLAGSAFRGLMRLFLPGSAGEGRESRVGLGVAQAKAVKATVTWSVPGNLGSARTTAVDVTGAIGTLDGALWAGEASPSPAEIVPALDAGPAALFSLPIWFGVAGGTNWIVKVDALRQNRLGPIDIPTPLVPDGTGFPLLLWRPHPTLALVSSAAMTRTAESATRPSRTRELVPSEVTSGGSIRLKFDSGRLPAVELHATATVFGGDRWHWPWPLVLAEGPGPFPSSPSEGAGVAMVSLTLPGIEFTPNEPSATIETALRVSLRYDLPILDELFANAKAPESKTPPDNDKSLSLVREAHALERPPTALDPERLSAAWAETAGRLARARTEADRVVFKEEPDGHGGTRIQLWHPLQATAGTTVRGLVEPYVWRPQTFAFEGVRPEMNGLSLGAYCLGAAGAWTHGSSALGGLSGEFRIDGVELKPAANGRVKISGFAASSFAAQDVADHLQDARGLSLALKPGTQGKLSSRNVALRAAPDNQTLRLATLTEAVPVKIKDEVLFFWFRDLPLTQGQDHLEFDSNGGLETGLGPDPTALDRNHLVRAAYEWRFYKPGRFDFVLAGPLVARPLRLIALECSDEGDIQRLEVLVTIQHDEGEPDDLEAPFAAEAAQQTGNLAILAFTPSMGQLVQSGFRRVARVPGPPPSFAATNDPLVLSATATVRDGLTQAVPRREARAPVSFCFQLDNSLAIASAYVRSRLFGQDCVLRPTIAKIDGDTLTASFAPPPGSSVLKLRKLKFAWAKGAEPELTLEEGGLVVPLRGGNEPVPSAFVRHYDGSKALGWLGLDIGIQDLGGEEVDHDTGVVKLVIRDQEIAANSELFRGFLLPSGRLRAVIAIAFRPGDSVGWPNPVLGSCFAEFSFDAAEQAGPLKRVTSIRHRHVGVCPVGQTTPQWTSRFLFDASFPEDGPIRSAVSWPVGNVTIEGKRPRDVEFLADPRHLEQWTSRLTMAAAGSHPLVLVHRAMPRLRAHELPVQALLAIDATTRELVLDQPWRTRVIVEHTLIPEGGVWPDAAPEHARTKLAWTSIDEIWLFDMGRLVSTANVDRDPPGPSERYAFLPRYISGSNEVRIAGVVRRTLADAGFPVRRILKAIAGEEHPPRSLVLAGAAVTEVMTKSPGERADGAGLGLAMIPQWILPWAIREDTGQMDGPYADLGGLARIPQVDLAERIYTMAAYDAAAGRPHPTNGMPAYAFAAVDGAQSLIEERLMAILGLDEKYRTTIPVDQAIVDDAPGLSGPLARPLFPRTLLALDAVVDAFLRSLGDRASTFTQQITCLAVRPLSDQGGGPRRRIEGEFKLSVTAWPADIPPPEAPARAVSLIVADNQAVRTAALPADLAAMLTDPASNALGADGQQRADASMRARGLSADPRIVLLGRVDDRYLRSTADKLQRTDAEPPHVDWQFADVGGLSVPARRARELRRPADTLYASPALGWPTTERVDELGKSHAGLGQEEVRRNEDVAWAGRARSLAYPAKAWGGRTDPRIDEIRDGAFLAMGQRVAFRRQAARNLTSTPDRLSVLAPPRARAPTTKALAAAFGQARIAGDAGAPLAPMLPGQIEVTVTGQRPGVFLTQHEEVLMTWQEVPFDPAVERFGRPAARGPLTMRQVRAPRSSSLREDLDLALRRRTFVARDDSIDDATLRPFRLFDGPATVFRFDRNEVLGSDGQTWTADTLSPHGVTLTVDDPAQGRLAPDWNGRIRLVAMTSSAVPSSVGLQRIGFLPKQGATAKAHAELQVGGTTVVFTFMTWAAQDSATVIDLLFETAARPNPAARNAAQKAIALALADATADTAVRLTFRGYSPLPATELDPGTRPEGEVELDTAETELLAPGPPCIVTLDLPHVPARRRWLPVSTFTLAFGDPAYDRELGSPAKNNRTNFDGAAHTFALDRAEYDLGGTIYFALWRTGPASELLPETAVVPTNWRLEVQIVPHDGGAPRFLSIAAIKNDRPTNPSYELKADAGPAAFALPLSSLRESSNADAGRPARIVAGDRLQLTIFIDHADGSKYVRHAQLSVNVGIVAEPVLPPPAAVYGLATRQGGTAVGTSLFATAPLPQRIEFPDLFNDLVAGHVRRRGLFLWSFAAPRKPVPGEYFAYLVKFDRTGGAQLPSRLEDFLRL